jgi:hypothetical protein
MPADLLLYMSYGRECYHQETMFSLLSARRHGAWDRANWRPLVYTDRPADYAWLGVDTRELTPELIADWVGVGYPFRRKIACVVDALEQAPGELAFLDGDTWFKRDPALLFDRIAPGRACLHLRELRLTRRPGTAGSALGPLFDRGVVRDAAGGPVRLRPGEVMWNSGVIGIDHADTNKAREALRLIDDVWAHEQRVHTLEQFALGHVLGAQGELRETGDLVFHYWHARQRAPFLARLPGVIARARTMPLAEAAEWSWRQRPVEAPLRRAAGVAREALHRAGINRRWTRTSF